MYDLGDMFGMNLHGMTAEADWLPKFWWEFFEGAPKKKK
jgi:hypothetical protein